MMAYCQWQPDGAKTRCSVCGFKLNRPFGPNLPKKPCTPARPAPKTPIIRTEEKAKRRAVLLKTIDSLLNVDEASEDPKKTVGEAEALRRLAICDSCPSFTGLNCKTFCPDCNSQAGIKMAKIVIGLSTITPGVPDIVACPQFTQHLAAISNCAQPAPPTPPA